MRAYDKSKKGLLIEPHYVIVLFLAAAILIFFIPFIAKFQETSQQGSKDTICTQTVQSNARMRLGAIQFSKEIKCVTQESKKKVADTQTSQDNIRAYVAGRMLSCANNFGNGKLNLFGDDEAVFCALCDHITLEGSTVKSFNEYLHQRKVPGTKLSYADHLAGYETPEFEKLDVSYPQLVAEPVDLEPGAYGVVYIYVKGKDNVEKFLRFASGNNLAGKIGMAGAVASGGTVVLMIAFNTVGGPVAWTITGVGAAVAGIAYLVNPDNVPEWLGYTYLTKYDTAELKKLGCDQVVTQFDQYQLPETPVPPSIPQGTNPQITNVSVLGDDRANPLANALQAACPTARVVASGASGDTTTQMATRVVAEKLAERSDRIIVLPSVADTTDPQKARSNLLLIQTLARAEGNDAILLTALPWKGHPAWTVDRQASTEELNAWIITQASVDAYSLLKNDQMALATKFVETGKLAQANAAAYQALAGNISVYIGCS